MSLGDRLVNVAPYLTVRGYELLLALRRDQLLAAIDRHVKAGDTVIDVGAYRGWYTDRLATRAGKRGRVHAVEPNASALPALKAIAKRHENVTIHEVAASDRSGTARLLRPYRDSRRIDAMGTLSNPVVDGMPHDEIQVAVEPLDQLLADSGSITFIKCDVEGHEHEVLVGAEQLVRANRPVIVMEIEQRHRQRPVQETLELLQRWGYAGQFVTRRGLRPLEDFDVERDQTRYVQSTLHVGRPHPDYVSDFVFLPG
jgi:FkbM family methyltransferase